MGTAVRYLVVDGHSVIFAWEELRTLHQQDRRQARTLLTRSLEQLHDTSSWRVTLVFDGKLGGKPEAGDPKEMVLLYGTADCTADSIIERLVGKAPKPNQVTVVTADGGERETVEAMGAFCLSPDWLKEELSTQSTLWQETMRQINRRARW